MNTTYATKDVAEVFIDAVSSGADIYTAADIAEKALGTIDDTKARNFHIYAARHMKALAAKVSKEIAALVADGLTHEEAAAKLNIPTDKTMGAYLLDEKVYFTAPGPVYAKFYAMTKNPLYTTTVST